MLFPSSSILPHTPCHMSSECSRDRTSAPPQAGWVGKKRTAPDDFANVEQTKRRQNISFTSSVPKEKGIDTDRSITHPDRLRTRLTEPKSPALASTPASGNGPRRFSFNDGSQRQDFLPLTRPGTGLTSPLVATNSHSDDSMFPNVSHSHCFH